MRIPLVCLFAVVLWSCSSAPTSAPREQLAIAHAPPSDESRRFAETGLIKMEQIPDHLLGKAFMPGGNLATYRTGGTEYQQFLGKEASAQDAAFLLLDWRKALQQPEYLAHMGGYYGMDKGRAVYVFTKGAWVAGIAGLPQGQADAIAREFAAHL